MINKTIKKYIRTYIAMLIIAIIIFLASLWTTFYFANQYRCTEFLNCPAYPIVPIWITGGIFIIISGIVVLVMIGALLEIDENK